MDVFSVAVFSVDLFSEHHTQTDRQTHDDGIYRA